MTNDQREKIQWDCHILIIAAQELSMAARVMSDDLVDKAMDDMHDVWDILIGSADNED